MVKKIFIAVLILLLAGAGYFTYRSVTQIAPEDLIQEAVQNTIQAKSYRYAATSRITNGDNTQFLSKVEGEKADTDQVHVKGTVLDVDMEMFQIGETTYNKDPFSERWYVQENSSIAQQELFMTEIDPLANFNFKEVTSAAYFKTEKIDGHKCAVVDVVPEIENQYLTLLWEDFTYTMWVDQKDRVLRKGLITARNKNNPEFSLQIQVEFKDFNEEIEITPPRI